MNQLSSSRDIQELGAIGDGKTLCTQAIQAAIDIATAPEGGGHVRIPAGVFLIGTLHLRSNLWLELLPGAVLLGSPRIEDYEALPVEKGGNKDLQPFHLFVAHGCKNLRISGSGRLDGNGPAFWHPEPHASGWFWELNQRPSPMIEISDCRHVRWEDVEIANSPGWTLHFKRCDDVVLRGISIRNNLFGPNTDGIDIDGCRDVRISDCLIEAGDDAIVLKTTPLSRSCERVTVTNCSIATNCRALKLGAHESFHDMRDVVFSNCVVSQSVAVFALYSRNGAVLENIAVSNIVGHAFSNPDYNQPIHIDCARIDPNANPGKIRHVSVSNFLCHSNGRILITGEAGHPVEHLSLRGIQFHMRDTYDPHPAGLTARGDQFSPSTPEARAARAAVVLQHANGVHLSDVVLTGLPSGFESLWSLDCENLESSSVLWRS